MAAVYWISFRIHEDVGYEATYEKLTTAVKLAVYNETWWFETTSFYLARSDLSIGDLASRLKSAIRPDRDLVVIGMSEVKNGRVIGKCDDQDIFALAPFMKKV